MKLLKVKKQDARPSIRIKAAGNVFVEVYKDNKGYFYRIDVPGATDFVSKERFESQDKARLAGTTHAKKFIGKVKGDQKKTDASPAFKKSKGYLNELNHYLAPCAGLAKYVAKNVEQFQSSVEAEFVLEDLQVLREDAERALTGIDNAIATVKKALK